jgi:predicted dienelactone hydrolase
MNRPYNSNCSNPPSAVISVSPINLHTPQRKHPLQVRVSAAVHGTALPIILFAHGFGSSMDAYAPLVNYWAARGFAVIQPTFPESRTFSANPEADHSEAVKAYLANPDKMFMWRYRVEDMKHILDQLDDIEDQVPGLKGRLDKNQIAAVGHSFGAQTTAALLGTRVITNRGELTDDLSDARIKCGILLSAGGLGGDALSEFGKDHFPHLNQSYAEMKIPALVVAGDKDISPLTLKGPEWFTEAYYHSPGATDLLLLHGGEHMLGGISGYLVRETTDEDPARVLIVQRFTTAYLFKMLKADKAQWSKALIWLREANVQQARVISKTDE